MKQLYLFAALLLSLSASAQFPLEHTYSGESGIVRVKLENSGEKYYGVNDATHQIVLYNADHTFWKSIPITQTNAEYTYIRHLSESKINPDAGIEVAYYCGYHIGATQTYISKVVKEDGSDIFSVPGANSINLSELEGLSNKIITSKPDGTSQVFDLSGNVEHSYTEGIVSRTKLENSGEKYFVIDSPNNALKVMNADHSIWKTVPLTKPAAAVYNYAPLLSETQVNTDPLLEVSYTYYQLLNGSSYYEGKLINENGDLLMTAPFCAAIFFSHLNGYPDKIMTRDFRLGETSTSVYSLPSLALEHVYPTLTYRAIMESAGEKYYTIGPENGQCKVYNGDHSIYKSVNLPMPAGATNLVIDQVSQNRGNNDNLVEVSYGYTQSISGSFYYEHKLVNESDEVLLTVPNCLNLSFLGAPNLTDKLIGLMYIQSSGFFGTVYGVSVLAVEDFGKSQQLLYPNPANTEFHINADKKIIAVEIYNAMGVLVKKTEGISIVDVDSADLSAGLYLLTLTDSNRKKSNHKIIISH